MSSDTFLYSLQEKGDPAAAAWGPYIVFLRVCYAYFIIISSSQANKAVFR